MAESVPIIRLTAYTLPIVSSNQREKLPKTPLQRSASTASKIPRKNIRVAPSIRLTTFDKRSFRSSLIGVFRYINSVNIHRIPTPIKIPMKGGRCVIVLNTGTNSRQNTPMQRIASFSFAFNTFNRRLSRFSSKALGGVTLPCK